MRILSLLILGLIFSGCTTVTQMKKNSYISNYENSCVKGMINTFDYLSFADAAILTESQKLRSEDLNTFFLTSRKSHMGIIELTIKESGSQFKASVKAELYGYYGIDDSEDKKLADLQAQDLLDKLRVECNVRS